MGTVGFVEYPYTSGVYMIVNSLNGRRYIGSAASLSRRQYDHFYDLAKGVHKNRHLQSAWRKYGANAFCFTVLLYCDSSNILFFEQLALDHHKRRRVPLYNINPNATSRRGSKMSETNREQLRQRMIGNKYAVGSTACVGRRASAETRAKLSASHMGKRPSPETRARQSARLVGRPVSEKTRHKLSAAATRQHALKRQEVEALVRQLRLQDESADPLSNNLSGHVRTFARPTSEAS